MLRKGDSTFDLASIARITAGELVGAEPSRPIARVSTDSRTTLPGDLFVALHGPRFDGHDHVSAAIERGAAACIVARRLGGLSVPSVVVSDTLDALERIALEHLATLGCSVTAITGSVGKTTTKEILARLLGERYETVAAPASFNNRIGVALTILSARSGTKHLVLELGTSGRGEISHLSRSVRPERVVVTDIAPAHLLGLSDMDGVVAAKAEIFDGFTGRGSAWVRAGITGLDVFAARARSRLRTFGWRKKGEEPTPDLAVSRCVAELSLGGDDVRVGYRFQIGDVELFLPVLGRHNVLNALGAIAVARECGLGFREIQRGLDSVSLPPRRLELVAVGPTLLIDDSYNANPRSFAGALDAWRELRAASPGRGVVVFGDMLELGDRALDHHEEAGRAIAASDVELLVCVGDYAGVVAESFREARATEGAGPGDVIVVDAAPAAIDALSQRLRAGDRILVKGSNASGAGAVAQAIRELLRADAGARAELREAAR